MLSQEMYSGQKQVSDGLLGSQDSAVTKIWRTPSDKGSTAPYGDVDRVQAYRQTTVQGLDGPLVIHIPRQITSYMPSCIHLPCITSHLPVYLSICSPTHLPISAFIYESTHPPNHLSNCTSPHPPIYPSIHVLPTHSSIHLSIYSTTHPSLHTSVHSSMDSSIHLLIQLFAHSLIHLAIQPFMHPLTHSSTNASTHTHPSLLSPSAHQSFHPAVVFLSAFST